MLQPSKRRRQRDLPATGGNAKAAMIFVKEVQRLLIERVACCWRGFVAIEIAKIFFGRVAGLAISIDVRHTYEFLPEGS